MAKTQQEIYAEKYRAGTLTQAERNTLLNAGKTLGVEETQKRLQSQVAPTTWTNPQTPVTQQITPQVSTVPQPTAQTPVVQPVTPPVTETPKVEAPKTPTVETPPTPITKDTSWNDIKDKNLSSLEQLVEARYGTVATQQNGKLVGQINGKNYEWGLDAQGNPIKTEVQLTETDKFRNKLAQRLQTATPDELYNALVSGKVPEDLKESLMMNPNYIEAQQKFAKKKSADSTNNIVGGMYNTMSGVQTEETDKVAELGTKKADELLAKGKTEQELVSYRDFIAQDTELTDSVSQLSNVSRQYSELKRTAEDNLKRIVDENPGLSKASAMLLSAKQNEYVYNQMDALSDEMAILQANIDYRTNLLDKDYEQMLVQEQRAYQESLMAEERAFAQAQTAEERKYQEELQTRQLEQKYAYEYGDLNSEDPTLQNIAIERAVAGMYENYPIPGMESQATKVQKVKQLIAQGMTGTQAIAQVESEIRNSQRYKDYIASEKAKTNDIGFTTFNNNLYKTDSQGNISLAVKGSQKWEKLDDGTYQNENGDILTKSELDQQKLLDNKFLKAPVGTNVGVECGVFASRGVGLTSTPGGNSLAKRIEAFNESSPIVGGMVLFNGGSYDKTYGHVSIVTGVNTDGTITVRESNLKGDTTVTERKVDINDLTISGYFNDTPLAGGGEGSTELSDKKYTQYNQAYSKFVANPQVKAFEEALSAGGDMIASLKSENGPGDVGAVFQFMKTLDPTSTVRETEFELAAKSAGVWEQFKNIPANKLEGTILTDEQRKAFGKLAFEYVKNKSKGYDIKYNDLKTLFKNQGIPDIYLPTKMSDLINEYDRVDSPVTTGTALTQSLNQATGSRGNVYTWD